ncbi:hemolysin family protein [uncultured Porphyromonas sp.]|uniref:hemolysin family protein n=1 Tax=uncultured Porphyromonas sp. TaxID=159274 RepID=UPI0025842AF6|nr:hemolysin family protein [uncultured Porphyromonas sp.]
MIYLYIFLCLIASAFFSGMEIAFLSSDKLRLELDRSRGGVSARILGIFYSRPDRFITTMLLGNNVALVIYGLLTAVLMEPWLKSLLGENDGLILLAQSVLSTLLILFVGEFLPKVTFRANPNRTMRFFAGILFLVYILLYPFAWIIGLITRAILFLAGQRTSSVAIRPQLSSLDLEYYLTHSSDDGQASGIETEVKIIQNAISFSGLQVRDCLLPRNEIVGASIDSTRAHLEELFIRTGLSKLIVYKENIDEVVGYIHSSEMFRGDDWQKRIVSALFVPESMQASTLMRLLMQKKKSIAVVIDELGGTAGMVTLEDIVEELFGDIEDEHDRQKRVAKRLDDRTFVFSGRMEIDDINEKFGLTLPEDEDFMTIAGYILYHHPSIPSQGQILEIGDLRFEILRSTSTKIVLVKMTLPEA